MASAIEAIYIFDSQNTVLLQHSWRHRPTSTPLELITTFNSYPSPRPPLIYLPNLSPPTLLFSIVHNNLVFISPTTSEIEPLLVLEFLHRVVDVLEDYFGPPLIPTKIEANYDIIAELLGEMCDDGLFFNTEVNGLRDVVLPPSMMKKIFQSVTLPSGSLDAFKTQPGAISTIPWRRANVKHTNNEMYLDMIESLHCTIAPSGRPLAARVNGTMAFTSKISGIPDMLLSLKTPGKQGGGGVGLEAPVFHPCVRLSRWKEKPGELSFVPPDGKFVLASYEVDLIPGDSSSQSNYFQLPVNLTMQTLLGPSCTEFEVKLAIPSSSPYTSHTPVVSSSSSFASRIGAQSAGNSIPSSFASFGGGSSSGTSNSPVLEDVSVVIPLPPFVRSLLSVKLSKGTFFHDIDGKNQILWKFPANALTAGTVVTFRAEVVTKAMTSTYDGDDETISKSNYDNDYDKASTTSSSSKVVVIKEKKAKASVAAIAAMPKCVLLNFTLKGTLLSGVKVDSLKIVGGKGMSESVKPYKGVKYLTIAREGSVEIRC